jgi:hypothetical protein
MTETTPEATIATPAMKARPGRARLLILAGAVVAVVVAVVAVVSLTGGDSKIAVKGGVLLTTESINSSQGRCAGSGGYEDMDAGTSVTIFDASGTTIATSTLDKGTPTDAVGSSCLFTFEAQVPSGDFYAIEVSHRGKVTFTKAEMHDGPVLTLGK